MTINEMLMEAITTDSRKRKARHQEELEALGYKIIKDGCWMIENPKNHRYIILNYNDNYIHTNGKNIRFGRIWSRKNGYVDKPMSVIDLYGLLNKREYVSYSRYEDKSLKVLEMRRALHDREYHRRNIDDAIKTYENALAKAKEEYEFNIEYHGKNLKYANEKIDKLLHKF